MCHLSVSVEAPHMCHKLILHNFSQTVSEDNIKHNENMNTCVLVVAMAILLCDQH